MQEDFNDTPERGTVDPEDRLDDVSSGQIPDKNRLRQNAEVPGEDITSEQLGNDTTNSESWLHYNKGLEQHGYSPADRITTENVSDLSLEYSIDVVNGIGDCVGTGQEANPTIVPGDPPIMYLSQGRMHVNALNARTGEGYWKFEYGIEEIDATNVRNRGVAVYGDKAYVAFPDETAVYPRLIALDRYTGEQQWETNLLTEEQQNFETNLDDNVFITQEPLLYDGKVFIGQSSDKIGWTVLEALDAESGERLWNRRVCSKDEWVGETWKFSSGAAWMTPTVDPESDTLFFATTNPDPMMNGVVRPGPNKDTQSIVALDPSSGETKWTTQMVTHDLWDYDTSTPPFVFDMEVDGEQRRAVAGTGKVGWVYVMDAENGRLLERSEGFARQNHWDEGFLNLPPAGEENMKPMSPDLSGAKEWLPESYSPDTGLYYCGSNNSIATVAYDPDWQYQPEDNWADKFAVGGFVGYPEEGDVSAGVSAVDPASGDLMWRHELEDVSPSSPAALQFTGGTTATAGGVVFHGSSGGHLVALDAESGDRLWRDDTGGRIAAQPIVWDDSDVGKQYVAVTSNSEELRVYSLEAESGGGGTTTSGETDAGTTDGVAGNTTGTAGAGGDSTSTSTPGFGVGSALGGLGGAGYLWNRIRGPDSSESTDEDDA